MRTKIYVLPNYIIMLMHPVLWRGFSFTNVILSLHTEHSFPLYHSVFSILIYSTFGIISQYAIQFACTNIYILLKVFLLTNPWFFKFEIWEKWGDITNQISLSHHKNSDSLSLNLYSKKSPSSQRSPENQWENNFMWTCSDTVDQSTRWFLLWEILWSKDFLYLYTHKEQMTMYTAPMLSLRMNPFWFLSLYPMASLYDLRLL